MVLHRAMASLLSWDSQRAVRVVAACCIILYVYLLSGAPSRGPNREVLLGAQHEDIRPSSNRSVYIQRSHNDAENSGEDANLQVQANPPGDQLPLDNLSDVTASEGDLTAHTSASPLTAADFFTACHAYDAVHRLQRWSLTEGNRLPYTGVGTKGDELLCTRGRSLFHLNSTSEANWAQLSTGNHRSPPLPPVHIRPLSREALGAAESAGRVVYHPHTAVITTALLSMYHLLNDFLVPLHATLRLVFRTSTQPPPIQRGALDIVLMYLDGQSRGHDNSDKATVTFAKAMVPEGGSLRLLIHPKEADADNTLHCYCRALLQPGAPLISLGPTARLIDGDPLRRAATRHIKVRLNREFGLLPFGTKNITSSEWRGHGLWNSTSPRQEEAVGYTTQPPRLLFLLRNKTRIIGNAAEIVSIAASVGFDVEVMTPERETVERQARAARYADVLMAIHGQALTWMTLMDGVIATHCPQVVELRHYGRKLRRIHNVYELLAADNYLMYRSVAAVDATFDPQHVSSQAGEKLIMMRKPFPHRYRGFSWQTAYYSASDVRHVLRKAFAHAVMCQGLHGGPYTLTSRDIIKSDFAWGR